MASTKIEIDFLVLGAQKAGTTALHDMLSLHPEIALPVHKETHFFSHSERAAGGVDWYRSQFRTSARTKLVGEIDPEYMFAPDAAKKIRQCTTARKFVFILRQPLKRAYSQYLMSRRRGYEPFDFGLALGAEQDRLNGDEPVFARNHWSYASRSLYSRQIEAFQRAFPDAEFLFLKSEELRGTDGTSGYAKVCRFIGTEPRDLGAAARTRSNVAAAPRSVMLRNFMFALNGKSKFRQQLMGVVPRGVKTAAFQFLERVNQKPIEGNPGGALRATPIRILDAMERDLLLTETLTALDLADWRGELTALRQSESSSVPS